MNDRARDRELQQVESDVATDGPPLLRSTARPMEPSPTFDGWGKPLVAHPELEQAVARGQLSDWLRRSRDEQLREHKTPSFRLDVDEVKQWIERRTGPFQLHLRDTSKEHLFTLSLDHALGVKEETHVWAHLRQLYVLGPGVSALTPWLVPHQVIVANPMIGVFRQDLRVRNPYRVGEYKVILDDAHRYGVDLGTALRAYGALIAEQPSSVRVPVPDRRQEESARDSLREIANREWNLERVPTSLPFWFRRAAEVPLVLLDPAPHAELDLVAAMGAGRMLRVRVCRFASTSPTALSAWGATNSAWGPSAYQVDGGDIYAWLSPDYDPMLDAESLVPRRHREKNSDDDE